MLMESIIIQDHIFEVSGKKVMLDFDLASLYRMETKRLKQALKRNAIRFPEDFMSQLNENEWIAILRTHFSTFKQLLVDRPSIFRMLLPSM